MKNKLKMNGLLALLIISCWLAGQVDGCRFTEPSPRVIAHFDRGWKFHLTDVEQAQDPAVTDDAWRNVDLPHDWSIEGEFSQSHPATAGGGALPGGIGWYRKTFSMSSTDSGKIVYIDFDGVYRDSKVWINGHYLGRRPSGYSSFRYELTPYLFFGKKNILAVRVDNSLQPNSRWYSGSGIYRHVRLTIVEPIHVDLWGTYVTVSDISTASALVRIQTSLRNASGFGETVSLLTTILDDRGNKVTRVNTEATLGADAVTRVEQLLQIKNPCLWSTRKPVLYTAVSQVLVHDHDCDRYETRFGVRSFSFDSLQGFSLNGEKLKLQGVCNHHDLGCLGAAIHHRALQRQLEILKAMGCNSIRTSHNPPAPELLDLCDRMGFLVMDEAFDMWKKKKSSFDYSMYWDEWHQRDLEDLVRRDRNHPSVFMWSIGNEILEQWDSSGVSMAQELATTVHRLDPYRPITSGCNDPSPGNFIIKSGSLDVIGYNYHEQDFPAFHKNFPGQKFLATETNSALATRGSYDMPSDSVRVWPVQWDKPIIGNADYTCSAYDNCRTGWGSTHADTWRLIKKHNDLSGMYIWTGFDYLGEPTPYDWPARSSYFGVIDLAGFPKDAYYFYQSEWSDKPVLHLFPHWNHPMGVPVDVWVYTNYEQVELFLNDKSLGKKIKTEDDFQLVWTVPFAPGVLRAVASKRNGDTLVQERHTAEKPSRIVLTADRALLTADNEDLAFITVQVVDDHGVLVPDADHLIHFQVRGEGTVVGVDNGLQTSHEPFKASYRKAFHGLCLCVVQTSQCAGEIVVTASADGLQSGVLHVQSR